MRNCVSCGTEGAENFCVRCKREICDDCWNPEWDLCRNCSGYKEGVRWDISQVLSHSAKTAEFVVSKLGTDCGSCPILRDYLLYLLKTTKSLAHSAKQEGLLDEQHHADEMRQALTNLSVQILVRQGFRANSNLWRHI